MTVTVALPGPVRLLLAGGGLGFAPVAPGTFGSLGAAILVALAGRTPPWGVAVAGALLVLSSAVTLRWGGRARGPDGEGDPGWVVSDELAGQALPSGLAAVLGAGVLGHAVAFVLFRVLDVVKPGPIRALERWPGGLGVLADDLGAGGTAALLLALLHTAGLPPGG